MAELSVSIDRTQKLTSLWFELIYFYSCTGLKIRRRQLAVPKNHEDKSDLLKKTERVKFLMCTNETEVMLNRRKQAFTYVIPESMGVKHVYCQSKKRRASEMPLPREQLREYLHVQDMQRHSFR